MLTFLFGFVSGVIVMLWICANAYMIDSVREQNSSFKKEVSEAQDSKIGRALMTLYYLPAKIYLRKYDRWMEVSK